MKVITFVMLLLSSLSPIVLLYSRAFIHIPGGCNLCIVKIEGSFVKDVRKIAITRSEWCFSLKMHHKLFGSWTLPGPAGEFTVLLETV